MNYLITWFELTMFTKFSKSLKIISTPVRHTQVPSFQSASALTQEMDHLIGIFLCKEEHGSVALTVFIGSFILMHWRKTDSQLSIRDITLARSGSSIFAAACLSAALLDYSSNTTSHLCPLSNLRYYNIVSSSRMQAKIECTA